MPSHNFLITTTLYSLSNHANQFSSAKTGNQIKIKYGDLTVILLWRDSTDESLLLPAEYFCVRSDSSSTHHQLSKEKLLVSVLATARCNCTNFTNHVNQVWWLGLDAAVTSLPPALASSEYEKSFWSQIWALPLPALFVTTRHSFTNHLNQVWWPSLDPAVTSLPLQLSPHLSSGCQKYFKCQIWVLPAIGFPTRHRSTLHDKYSSWNCKMFAWGALFPMSS